MARPGIRSSVHESMRGCDDRRDYRDVFEPNDRWDSDEDFEDDAGEES